MLQDIATRPQVNFKTKQVTVNIDLCGNTIIIRNTYIHIYNNTALIKICQVKNCSHIAIKYTHIDINVILSTHCITTIQPLSNK